MVDELASMTLKAIGVVRNEIRQPVKHGTVRWEEITSDIVVERRLTEALDGLEEFSHIIVLYWMHQVPTTDKLPMKVYPKGNHSLPLVGVFATRSPQRPNPVGKATVKLLKRQGNILTVKGLDATDGTPVIDIKPYLPGYDSVTRARVSPWATTQ